MLLIINGSSKWDMVATIKISLIAFVYHRAGGKKKNINA